MTSNDIKYLTEGICKDITGYLKEEYGLSITEALDFLYNSATYEKLINPATGLYFQSSKYVYTFLKHEMETGRIA